MESLVNFSSSIQSLGLITICLLILSLLYLALSEFWLKPLLSLRRLKRNGFHGPPPSFPLGNLMQMKTMTINTRKYPLFSSDISHDIHPYVFPYFAKWKDIYGKVFVYWLGTEPFLYVSDPELVKRVSSGALSKKWGKCDVFKNDRRPLFGNGLVMSEGEVWSYHRLIVSPAFSTTSLNRMIRLMEDSTHEMLEKWSQQIGSRDQYEIDVEKDLINNAAKIIAETSFGMNDHKGQQVFDKLQLMQKLLFNPKRLVGVPFTNILHPRQTYAAQRLGKQVDRLLIDIVNDRRKDGDNRHDDDDKVKNLLGHLVGEVKMSKCLTAQELADECKTFFFGGLETTSLAVMWTLLLLALYPEWQSGLRDEIMEVFSDVQDGPLEPSMLNKLKKMGWVWNETLRLYCPAPNTQRQAKEDIPIAGESLVIPKGTNMWVDIVGMHHDPSLWGDDVKEFKPERFKDGVGCKHRMGYMPFGMGERVCVGKNFSELEFRVVLTLILRRFTWSLSPAYSHSPKMMLTLRPSTGLQLLLRPIR